MTVTQEPKPPKGEEPHELVPALADGTVVTAVPMWLKEAQADAQVDGGKTRDPMIPMLEDAPESVTGPLKTIHVVVDFASIDYIKYMVGGYEVEPDSIEAIDSSSGAKHAMPGQPFSGSQHIAGMDYADHVKAQPWKYQALASHMAKGHDMSAGRMQSLWQKAGNQADFRRRLAMDHAVAHGMRAAAAGKPAGAGRAAGAGRPAPTARQSPGIVQPTGATKLVGWHTWSHAMGVEDEPTSVSCYYLGDKIQMYTLGDDGVVTCDDPNSEEMADGVQPMPDQPPPPIMPSDGTDFLRALLLLNRTASYYSWVVDDETTDILNAIATLAKVGMHVDEKGVSPEMVAVLRQIMQNVDPARRAAGMAWYQSVHDAAMQMAAKYNTDPAQCFAVIAACSQNMAWSNAAGDKYPNAQLADTVLGIVQENPSFHIDDLTAAALEGAVSSGTGTPLGLTAVEPGDYKFSELPTDVQAYIAVREAGTGGIPLAVEAAINIARGGNIDEELSGNKIRSFDNNIADPNNPNYACIDRWAARAAFGFPIGGNPKSADDLATMPLTDAQVESFRSSNGGYRIMMNSYIQTARDLGLMPNQAQAVIWMATHRIYAIDYHATGDITWLQLKC